MRQLENPASSLSPSTASGFADSLQFLKAFLREPNAIASIVPSSKRLIGRAVDNAQLSEAKCVVELGPGTGGSTRVLLSRMPPKARLLTIEMNSDCHEHLRRNVIDARLQSECTSAENLVELIAAHRLPAPDAIISGIPFSTMPVEVGDRIAAAIAASLAPGGRFVAYQWTPRVADRTIPYLGEPKREWELFNIPPMRVFTWVKPAA
jgi:phospholipid N-methyltransferase